MSLFHGSCRLVFSTIKRNWCLALSPRSLWMQDPVKLLSQDFIHFWLESNSSAAVHPHTLAVAAQPQLWDVD